MHVNHNLPPVDVEIFIRLKDGSFHLAKRTSWITKSDTAFTVTLLKTNKTVDVPRGNVAWYYT